MARAATLDDMGRVLHLLLIALCLIAPASAQTTVAMGDDPDASVVLPKGWIAATGVTTTAGFRGRGDAPVLLSGQGCLIKGPDGVLIRRQAGQQPERAVVGW